jgi:hypothetical protein
MRFLCVLLLCLGWYGVAVAARTVNSEGLISVKLELGQPSAMVFPEEVSTVTTAMAAETTATTVATLKITKDNAYVGFLVVNPAMPPNRNVVVGISGRVYLVKVELAAPGKPGDDLVYVTHKAPAQAEILTPVSVLRTLRSAKGPGPSHPLTLPVPTHADPRVVLSNPRQYQMGPYQALILTLENTQDALLQLDERVGLPSPETPLTVQLQSWVWPPGRRLSAVALEQPFLAPHSSTTLYAIFEER